MSNLFSYPQTPRKDGGETLHDIHVPDPYRWLEDLDADSTRDWIAAQNRLTFDFLKQIPERETVRSRIETLWNYEKFGIPFTCGKRLFYSYNNGLQNQSVMYWMPDRSADPIELLDPNHRWLPARRQHARAPLHHQRRPDSRY